MQFSLKLKFGELKKKNMAFVQHEMFTIALLKRLFFFSSEIVLKKLKPWQHGLKC